MELCRRAFPMDRSETTLLVLVLMIAGCQRQIPIIESPTISGYEVQGTVTDQVGNPIPSVRVFVDYDWDAVPTVTAATRTYFVSDPSTLVAADVVDWSGRVVRILSAPRPHYGAYQEVWNGKDSAGILPPSGIYYVRYLLNGVVSFTYSQLVSGGQVAATDAQGQYTILPQNLPIDSTSVPYFSPYDSTYVGSIVILNDVVLTYSYPNHFHQIQRSLDKGQVSIVNVVFH
jgi:hypothetical protein